MFPPMTLNRAALLVSALFLFISCGGDGGGGTGGSGGVAGAHGGSSGGGASGSTGSGGSTGTAGATGSGGSGAGGTSGGSCQACVPCVTSKCATPVATCMANTGCNKIYECAKGCTTSIQTCVSNNIAAAQAFASSVYACIMANCNTECMY